MEASQPPQKAASRKERAAEICEIRENENGKKINYIQCINTRWERGSIRNDRELFKIGFGIA